MPLWISMGQGHVAGPVQPALCFAALPSRQRLCNAPQRYRVLVLHKDAFGPIYARPIVTAKGIFVKDKDAVTLWSIQ